MTLDKKLIEEMVSTGRKITIAEKDDKKLGPLAWLPGKWENTTELKGYGFNMMALPFQGLNPKADPPEARNGYRLLMNQYNEVLNFSVADYGVPNRGSQIDPTTGQTDQTIVALEYNQVIRQMAFEDSFLKQNSNGSTELSKTCLSEKFENEPIHHEPGLWLYMTDHTDIIDEFTRNEKEKEKEKKLTIARLGSIPHGNSFLAMGFTEDIEWQKLTSDQKKQKRFIPNINGVVIGGGTDPDQVGLDPVVDPDTGKILIDYFAPYRYFHENPFKGKGNIPEFNGLDPVHTTALLRHAVEKVLEGIGQIRQIKILHVDSTTDHAGIHSVTHSGIVNIPFVARQADTTAINATFLIYEIEDSKTGKMRYFMQYAQNVIMDFINRPDGHPGRARWPHVSINTMERVADAYPEAVTESLLST